MNELDNYNLYLDPTAGHITNFSILKKRNYMIRYMKAISLP